MLHFSARIQMVAGFLIGAALTTAAQADTVVVTADKMIDVLAGKVVDRPQITITDGRITATDTQGSAAPPAGARRIDLPGMTLLPGLIEAHSHLLLHPYNEASWEDQVLKESLTLRVCRATNHARKNLLSGFTT